MCACVCTSCVDSSMVRIRAFQARGPGSIPGRRIFLLFLFYFCCILGGTYGVMVSIGDSESPGPGSNPGGSFHFFIFIFICVCVCVCVCARICVIKQFKR